MKSDHHFPKCPGIYAHCTKKCTMPVFPVSLIPRKASICFYMKSPIKHIAAFKKNVKLIVVQIKSTNIISAIKKFLMFRRVLTNHPPFSPISCILLIDTSISWTWTKVRMNNRIQLDKKNVCGVSFVFASLRRVHCLNARKLGQQEGKSLHCSLWFFLTVTRAEAICVFVSLSLPFLKDKITFRPSALPSGDPRSW